MRRIPELDGLRGLAALAVVLFHLYLGVFPFGWAAVDLFFVLSGFLITGIVVDHMDEPRFLRRFYARRSLRIWPIYYLTLAVLLGLGAVSLRDWLPFALYLQNTSYYLANPADLQGAIFAPDWPLMNHAWSLAVEEQFYLVWPGLIVLAGRRRVGPLAVGCLAGSIAARWAGYPSTILLSRCDGLALGALLAAVLHRPHVVDDASRRAAVRPWLWAAGSLLIVLGVRLGWKTWTGAVWLPLSYRLDDAPAEVLCVSLIAFMTVAWTTVETGRRVLAPLRWKPLRDLGTISYGLYLYHAVVLHSLQEVLPRSIPGYYLVEGVLTLGASLALAAVSWRFVERPILKLKDRFDYQRADEAPEPAAVSPSPVRADRALA